MIERKKYLDINGVKVFWNKTKELTDDITKELSTSAADISSLKFNETAVVGESGVSITLNKSNISSTINTPTTVTIPFSEKESPGIIKELTNGNGISVENTGKGSIRVNVSTDNSSIKLSDDGNLSVDIVDGGFFD